MKSKWMDFPVAREGGWDGGGGGGGGGNDPPWLTRWVIRQSVPAFTHKTTRVLCREVDTSSPTAVRCGRGLDWTWLDRKKKTPRLRWRVVFPQVPVSGHVPQCGETHGHLRPKERHTHNDGEQKENSVEASRSSPGRPPKPPGRSRCTSPGFGRCWARRSCKRPSTDERERERERERDKNELSWPAGRHYDDTIGTDR